MNSTNRGATATSQHHPRPTLGLAEIATGCSAPDCEAPSIEDAPFPICAQHYVALVRHWDSMKVRLGGEAAEPVAQAQTVPLGWVYFLRFGDLVKIGHTRDLQRRRREIPHDELLGAVRGGPQQEREWHQRFDYLREQGEWFSASPPLLDAIAKAC